MLKTVPTGRDTSLVWLSLTLAIILALTLLLPLSPEDYWWYVRLGQDISQSWHIPTVDTYSYTQTGQPIIYHSWLSAVLFWAVHLLGGNGLTVLLRSSCLVLLYLAVWLTCRHAGAGPRLASGLTLLAALVASNNWAIRPQIFSYPLFGWLLLTLWLYQAEGDAPAVRRWLWLPPLLILAWVNLHGAFILGFLLVGVALLTDRPRRWVWLVLSGGMLLASLINPRGYGAWLYVLTLLTDPSSQQLGPEWQPPTNQNWQGALFFGWLLLFAPLVAATNKRLTVTQWGWFLLFGWMALSGLRYVIWFSLILAPLTAHLLVGLRPLQTEGYPSKRPGHRPPRGIPLLNRAISLLLILLTLPLLPGLRAHWWDDAPPVLTDNTPIEATAWLATQSAEALPGPLWSHISFSSYLIYALPERPVWSDTRLELYPLEQSQRYLDLSQAAPNWQQILDEAGINLLMIDSRTQADLVTVLQRSAAWRQVYADERVLIFSRRVTDGS